jgi:glycosyltransferase involved in cell wall biosynthesis
MKICFLGLDNLPVLMPEFGGHTMGGESVQQTLLARALARRGHLVSMVSADYGQRDGACWDGVRVWKAYRPHAGIPVLRFIHPRWSGIWSALRRADADVYYTSCAGMQVGLLALFCRRHGRRFVFRTASDSDCDASRLLVRFMRDRWLYAFGLRRADAILVQGEWQRQALARNYGLRGRVAGMLVEQPQPVAARDIDVLWVGNIRPLKRPDRALELAGWLPQATLHMVGGPLPGEAALFDEVQWAACTHPNVSFHGGLPYHDANRLYDRARVLVNTSDVEGFPNSYLQAWIAGVPVVTLIDPDGVIAREGLGAAVTAPELLGEAVRHLLADPVAWRAASDRCRAYMARHHDEGIVLADYLETFDEVLRGDGLPRAPHASRRAHHA